MADRLAEHKIPLTVQYRPFFGEQSVCKRLKTNGTPDRIRTCGLWFRRPTLKAMAKARGFSNFSLVSPLDRSILTLAEGLAGKFSEKSDPANIKVDARADFSYFISSCNIHVPFCPSYTHSCPACSLTPVRPGSDYYVQ